ncbi:MAG: GtrA family protein [Ignavibacteriales bacterium]|nr:GtrA family protein [Ignavibacteriales bacterium]
MNDLTAIRKNFIYFIKYSFVGIGNLIFTLALYIFFLNDLELKYEIAFTFAWLLGVLFTYLINFIWVFKPEEKITFRKRLPKYFFVYLLSYLLNILLLKLLVENFFLQPLISQLFIIPLIVLINFTGIKYWALK